MGKFIDLTGMKFGRLTVLRIDFKTKTTIYWICKCDCGTIKSIIGDSVRCGKTKSCGCYAIEKTNERCTKHGDSPFNGAASEYYIWKSMKDRCRNPNNKCYHNYGGRGISVCAEWIHSYETFLKDVGRKPTPKHTLERIENNKGYYKGNVRWATRTEQMNNTRANVNVTINGVTKNLKQWCIEKGLYQSSVYRRMKKGWSIQDAIYTEKKEGKHKIKQVPFSQKPTQPNQAAQ